MTAPLGFVLDGLLTFPGPVTCDCAGARTLEMLAEPPVMDRFWHVCSCCGARQLLPRNSEEGEGA